MAKNLSIVNTELIFDQQINFPKIFNPYLKTNSQMHNYNDKKYETNRLSIKIESSDYFQQKVERPQNLSSRHKFSYNFSPI